MALPRPFRRKSPLITDLEEGDGDQRAAAARELAGNRAPEVIDALVRRLVGEGYRPAQDAIRAALLQQPDLALQPLVAMLGEIHARNPDGATDLIDLLGELGDPRAVPALAECLDARHVRVTDLVEKALMRIGGPEAEQSVTAFHAREPADTRALWVAQARSLITERARRDFPGHEADVNMLGIAHPDVERPDAEAAERLVQRLEGTCTFEEVHLRATVRLPGPDEESPVRHIDIVGGEAGDFYWPPHEDWGRTAIIFRLGHVTGATFP